MSQEHGQGIPITGAALSEARKTASEIVGDVELSRLPLANIALKASRLARLLNDSDYHMIFKYEAGGYPSSTDGIPENVFELGKKAGRVSLDKLPDGTKADQMSTLSIEAMQSQIDAAHAQISAASDAAYSFSSSNPRLILTPQPSNNSKEREQARVSIRIQSGLLARSRSLIYDYALEKLLELSYSEIAGDAFSRIRAATDQEIGHRLPKAVEKFSAIYNYLESENSEDWANAVHSCRRILKNLADSVFPAAKPQTRGGKEVKLDDSNYINRLICFAEDNSTSERFQEIVGSHLKFLGQRLDAINKAASKGTHTEIATRSEADRYVVFTYMLVHDILSLNVNDS